MSPVWIVLSSRASNPDVYKRQLPDDGRTKIRLGASMANYWIGAGALLDDISFFGKALNASEVAQLYDETATSELATGIVVSSDDATVNVDKTIQLTATLEPAGRCV